ncbi:hypothetical protein ACIQ57_23795 [Lysinibacillus xylanilyticus]
MAHEECLAASNGLYNTQLCHDGYYSVWLWCVPE